MRYFKINLEGNLKKKKESETNFFFTSSDGSSKLRLVTSKSNHLKEEVDIARFHTVVKKAYINEK